MREQHYAKSKERKRKMERVRKKTRERVRKEDEREALCRKMKE